MEDNNNNKIEFAVSGSFEQLSWFKKRAEQLGWQYIDDLFDELSYKDYPILYFCDELFWGNEIVDYILNGFSLISSVPEEVIIFNLDIQLEKALLSIKHGIKGKKPSEMTEFLDFIVNNYLADNSNKQEVVKKFTTMYGQTKV